MFMVWGLFRPTSGIQLVYWQLLLIFVKHWPRSTTDSIEVSEAFDSGSIPDEATTNNK